MNESIEGLHMLLGFILWEPWMSVWSFISFWDVSAFQTVSWTIKILSWIVWRYPTWLKKTRKQSLIKHRDQICIGVIFPSRPDAALGGSLLRAQVNHNNPWARNKDHHDAVYHQRSFSTFVTLHVLLFWSWNWSLFFESVSTNQNISNMLPVGGVTLVRQRQPTIKAYW